MDAKKGGSRWWGLSESGNSAAWHITQPIKIGDGANSGFKNLIAVGCQRGLPFITGYCFSSLILKLISVVFNISSRRLIMRDGAPTRVVGPRLAEEFWNYITPTKLEYSDLHRICPSLEFLDRRRRRVSLTAAHLFLLRSPPCSVLRLRVTSAEQGFEVPARGSVLFVMAVRYIQK